MDIAWSRFKPACFLVQQKILPGSKCPQIVIGGVLNVNNIDNANKSGEVDLLQTVREAEPGAHNGSAGNLTLRSFRNEAEIRAVNYALDQAGWNRRRAAKLLSISYRSLLYKIRQHNITPAVGPAKQLSPR